MERLLQESVASDATSPLHRTRPQAESIARESITL